MVNESVTPMARKAPIFGSSSCSGCCMMCTSDDRKAKEATIAIRSVSAIFTIVHLRSSRCSRNGFDVSLSGTSRNLKILRSAIRKLRAIEGKKPPCHEARAHTQGTRVADFIVVDHPAQLISAKRPAIETRFGLVSRMVLRTQANRTCQKEISLLVGKAR